ncbi:MAG TPA: tRNA-guanine transglycosylase, partial [Anaerolineae bacterium]
GRLYTFADDPSRSDLFSQDWFAYVYVTDDKHIKDARPVSPWCDCLACTRYSLGYLHHLYKVNDTLFFRLATIHNLRFMAQFMAKLKRS